jgi:hypothetical protein
MIVRVAPEKDAQRLDAASESSSIVAPSKGA